MTLEQAIEVLISRYNSGVIRGRIDDEWRSATDTVIAALREQGWVKTSERLPAEADTGDDGKILCVIVGVFGGTVILHVFWGMVAEHPERYPYWMPIPKLPEVE